MEDTIDFTGKNTAAYTKPSNVIGTRKAFANDRVRQQLSELIETAGRMREATTEAAYHLRKTKLQQIVKALRLT